MVKSVDFAVRDYAGGVSRGMVAGDGASDFIQVGAGDEISLNLRKYNILKYVREGDDLQIVLVDGRVITLSGYYSAPEGQEAQLYISADNEISAVTLEDGGDGVLFAQYGAVEVIGKWSPNDQLAFMGGEDILAPIGDDDTTGMAAFAPLIGGLGTAGLAGAGLVGLGVLTGGGDGGGSGGAPAIIPTVDEPDADYTLTTNTEDPAAIVTGTGEAGSTVTVTLGDQTAETTVDEDGTWEVTFEDDTFPSDGDLTAIVDVVAPDGTEYTLDGPDFLIDMTPPEVAVTEGTQSVGDIENLVDYADGISISGTGEAGAAISVEVGGQTATTVVGENGTWTVTFTQDELPGGTYTEGMVITATDVNGNVTTITDTLVVDTEPHPITFDAVTGDDMINNADWQGGVTVTGTSTPGATLQIGLGTVTVTTLVGADGTWSAYFSESQLPTGEGDLTFTASTVDGAGNASSASHTVAYDTVVEDLSHATTTPNAQIADGIVNAAEGAGGLVVTGTVEAGSVVSVQLGNGAVLPASVTGGTWTVTIPAGMLPTTEVAGMALTVSATDANGNVATQSSMVDFDPVVRNFTVTPLVAGDNIVNANEAAAGFEISGTVEAGSQVVVRLANGAEQVVTAGADGLWSVSFDQSALSGLTGSMTYTVTATDLAGNVAVLNDNSSQSFTFDLDAPDAPIITDKTDDGSSTRAIYTSDSEGDHFTVSTVGADGTVSTVLDSDPISLGSEDLYDFGSGGRVPNGEYLVVTDADAAGNTASTLLVVDGNSDVTIDLGRDGLEQFDLAAIDLSYAEATLTITEEQLLALTGPDNTMIISGDANDNVTALGAQDTGQDAVINGQTHSIYTLGDDGASLIIDDQITHLTI